MINCSNTESTRSKFTNGKSQGMADIPSQIEEGENCFSPPDLLEAALASCVALNVRVFAESHNIKLDKVSVNIRIDENDHDNIIAYKKINLEGDFSETDKTKLLKAADTCKIGKILTKGVTIVKED